jgi:nicotinamide mononucleotide transporter
MKFLKSMTKFEKVWLAVFSVVILAATVYFSATGTKWEDWKSITLNWLISPVSALTGVFCVIQCARGKLNNWIWGLINSATYGLVAWVSGYYGDWMLNWFYFLPTQLFIYFLWKNKIENGTVKMKRLTNKQRILSGIIGIVCIVSFALFLTGVDNFFTKAMERNSAFYGAITSLTGISLLGPILDSSTVILQVAAEILLILCFAEQWPLWIATNVLTIGIWTVVVATDPTSYAYSIPTLIMWVAFLINSIYGMIVWYKGSRNK